MVHVKVDPKYFRPTEVVSPLYVCVCVLFIYCMFKSHAGPEDVLLHAARKSQFE